MNLENKNSLTLNENYDYKHNSTHTSTVIIVLIPIVILSVFLITLIILLRKFDSNNPKTNLKIIFYYVVFFIGMPFVIIFLFINLISITISLIFCNKLYYISFKTISQFFTCLFSKCKKEDANTVTVIKKANSEVVLPERANKYKEVADNSKEKGENRPDNLNLNQPKVETNLPENTSNNVGTRPQLKMKNKGKNSDFVAEALNKDNTPAFVVLLNMIKSKAKNKIENKNHI